MQTCLSQPSWASKHHCGCWTIPNLDPFSYPDELLFSWRARERPDRLRIGLAFTGNIKVHFNFTFATQISALIPTCLHLIVVICSSCKLLSQLRHSPSLSAPVPEIGKTFHQVIPKTTELFTAAGNGMCLCFITWLKFGSGGKAEYQLQLGVLGMKIKHGLDNSMRREIPVHAGPG